MSNTEWLPKDQRKKILLLSDDARMPSGVGVISKEIILKTCHRYNWVQLGAAVQHPEQGKVFDLSESIEKEFGIKDPDVKIYPYNGYGDMMIVRHLIEKEKPDAIMHFTDPRFWVWLYQMEHEIRTKIPIVFYHVWDAPPFPKWNKPFYDSCDAIYSISKQTHNIVRNVWNMAEKKPWQARYIPHGVDNTIWKKLGDTDEELDRVAQLRTKLFREDASKVKFVVLYNNRNIQRKKTSNVILAYRDFLLGLPAHKRDECRLVLHTHPVDENGTDLPAVLNNVAPEVKVVFSQDRVDTHTMNALYNNADVVINLSNAEGFGIGTLEALMAERMIIATVTGGLQDQMGFRDEDGNLLDAEKHFNANWTTNAEGTYKNHGEWAIPLFPNNRNLIGSPQTPYLFEDNVNYQSAAKAIRDVYDMGKEERERRGALGREYALSEEVKMSATQMAQCFIDGFDELFENWTPRNKVGIYKA